MLQRLAVVLLWAEVLFGLLVLFAIDVFWSWVEDPTRPVRFGLAFAVAVVVARFANACGGLPHGGDVAARRMLWIFVVAFVVRALFLPAMFGLPLVGDEKYYWWVPRHLAAGDLAATTLRPPLWGFLLAIPEWIERNPISGRALTVVLGACAPVLVYRIGTRVFDERTGWVAGLLYAVYPTHIGYSHGLWAEVLFGSGPRCCSGCWCSSRSTCSGPGSKIRRGRSASGSPSRSPGWRCSRRSSRSSCSRPSRPRPSWSIAAALSERGRSRSRRSSCSPWAIP
jgi:hypothetical protein